MRELSYFLNMSTSSAQSIKDSLEVSTILHGDDSQLILFVDPDKEGLFFVMEDTSSIGPVSVETNCLKEPISLLEQEVIINQLLSLHLSHVVQWVVCSSEIACETFKCLYYISFDLNSLLVCDSRSERESIKVSTYSDSSTLDHLSIFL